MACALSLCGSVASAGSARTKKPPAAATEKKAAPVEPPPRMMDFSVTHRDQITQFHVDGNHLRVRTTAREAQRELAISDADRKTLADAARRATTDDDTRYACMLGEEYFLVVTIDGHTNSTAICDQALGPAEKGWPALLALARKLDAP